jgi:protein SCO1/2
MKNLLIIALCFLAAACQKNVETHEEELNEMSVFQLPTQWETQDGDNIALADLKGNVLVTVMIYTSCKMACPRLVADMQNIEKSIGSKTKTPVKYLLISIDPETDTPQRLKSFAKENNMTGDQWLFMRGSEENTREFANVLAVKYASISPIDFSHSNIISVFDKGGVMQHQMEGLAVNNEETLKAIRKYAAL